MREEAWEGGKKEDRQEGEIEGGREGGGGIWRKGGKKKGKCLKSRVNSFRSGF